MKLNVVPIICCDYCNETYLSQLEPCPICNNIQQINEYGDLRDEHIEKISCENCSTVFKKISGKWYNYFDNSKDRLKVKIIKK